MDLALESESGCKNCYGFRIEEEKVETAAAAAVGIVADIVVGIVVVAGDRGGHYFVQGGEEIGMVVVEIDSNG